MTAGTQFRRASAVADLLGLSERTVRRRLANGDFASAKAGGARLVDLEALGRRCTSLDLLESEDDGREFRRQGKPIRIFRGSPDAGDAAAATP